MVKPVDVVDFGRDTSRVDTDKLTSASLGIVNVWDIESVKDPMKRAVAEATTIRIGSRWLLERRGI